jgi:hypothetical protein
LDIIAGSRDKNNWQIVNYRTEWKKSLFGTEAKFHTAYFYLDRLIERQINLQPQNVGTLAEANFCFMPNPALIGLGL